MSYKTLGIIFALDIETRGLKRALSHSRRIHSARQNQAAWQFGEINIIAEISGMGRGRCSESVNRLIDEGAMWIACAGFAAALDEKARVGDVVVADRVMLAGYDTPALSCSEALVASIPPSGRLGYNIWRSDLVTCDSMILRASKKSDIYHTTGAAALDMEAHAVAAACEQKHIPFIVVKGISDTAAQDLPDEIEALASASAWTRRLGLIMGRPNLWPELLRLRRNSLLASDNLGDTLATMLLRLFA